MISIRTRSGRMLGLLAAAMLVVPAAWAEKSRETEQDEKEKVYTTEDLERLYADRHGTSNSAVKTKAAQPQETGEDDPLSRLERQQAEQAERRQQVAEAERQVAAAKKRVGELRQRILATKNPLLARPPIPDEERAEWDAQDGAARVRSSEKKLRQAREELDKAKAELARLRSGA